MREVKKKGSQLRSDVEYVKNLQEKVWGDGRILYRHFFNEVEQWFDKYHEGIVQRLETLKSGKEGEQVRVDRADADAAAQDKSLVEGREKERREEEEEIKADAKKPLAERAITPEEAVRRLKAIQEDREADSVPLSEIGGEDVVEPVAASLSGASVQPPTNVVYMEQLETILMYIVGEEQSDLLVMNMMEKSAQWFLRRLIWCLRRVTILFPELH